MGIPRNQALPGMNWNCATVFLICLRQSMLVSQACLWQLFDLTQQNLLETEQWALIALDTPFWQSCAVGNSWLWWKWKTGVRESKFSAVEGVCRMVMAYDHQVVKQVASTTVHFFKVLLKKYRTSMKNTTAFQPFNSSQITRLSSMQEMFF